MLEPGAVLSIKDLLTLMIIVSDNTATDLLYDKVGGPEAVTALMRQYGLSATKTTGTADDWFKALRAAPSAAAFHKEGKHPFGLSSPRDIGKLLENEGLKAQAAVNSREQFEIGGFEEAFIDAVLDARKGHETMSDQVLEDQATRDRFMKLVAQRVYDLFHKRGDSTNILGL